MLDDIPAFMHYLKVSEDDDEYIDMMCDKLMILQEDDRLVMEGLTFNELFQVMKSIHFFQGMELTEKEPVSVMCTQTLLSIILSC